MSLRKYSLYVLLIVLALAACKALFAWGQMVFLEAHGPLDGDSANYFILGRTMLNGFTLYRDYFDVQPPGIFLLTALSLLLTGGEKLTTVLVLLSLAILPATFTLFVWRKTRGGDRIFRLALILTALIIGILLTLYLEERAPNVETQLFGGVLGALFALAMIHHPDRFDRIWTPLAALFLLGSIMLKEPFLLSNIAVAILIARSRAHFLWGFMVPLALGGIAGAILLMLLGIFLPYVASLHTTFVYRSAFSSSLFGPVSYRFLSYYVLFQNLTEMYVAAPMLGYLMLFLWSRAPAHRTPYKGAERTGVTLTLLMAVGCGAIILTTIQRGLLYRYVALQGLRVFDPFLPVPSMLFLFGMPFLGSLPFLYRRGLLRSVFLTFIALSLTALAVGTSVYSGNHFAFAIPTYAAVALLFLRESAMTGKIRAAFLCGIILAVVTIATYHPNPNHLLYLKNRMGFTRNAQRERTDRLDALLDACKVPRFHNEALPEFAMARHSTFGPLIMPYEYLGADHPLAQETAERIIDEAVVVVSNRDYAQPSPVPETDPVVIALRQMIPTSFTTEAPSCAAPFMPIEGFTVWFRRI